MPNYDNKVHLNFWDTCAMHVCVRWHFHIVKSLLCDAINWPRKCVYNMRLWEKCRPGTYFMLNTLAGVCVYASVRTQHN